MNINISILEPSNDIGFVEDKRCFCVEGRFDSDKTIPDNAILKIELLDSNLNVKRYVKSNKKNQEIFTDYKDLITYSDSDDPSKRLLVEYGFPILIVENLENPYESINKASIKCWYSDTCFKAIIVNASNKETGAVFDDGINMLDDDGNPYCALDKGEYLIKVNLTIKDKTITTSKKIIIGNRENQLICRFNPNIHKRNMIEFSKINNFSIINDLIPGYLNPYLGNWVYHMGLLKMYRANDVCLYQNTHIRFFNYLIDENSTSYKTELAYLQTQSIINNEDRFTTYYYDIGEAVLGVNKQYYRLGNIRIQNDELILYRIDEVDKNAEDGVFNTGESNIINIHYDLNNILISNDFVITGAIKPIQLNKEFFILNDDNTYTVLDYPYVIEYCFEVNKKQYNYEKKCSMNRIIDNRKWGSVYEFYNKFNINSEWIGSKVKVNIKCKYLKGHMTNNVNLLISFK